MTAGLVAHSPAGIEDPIEAYTVSLVLPQTYAALAEPEYLPEETEPDVEPEAEEPPAPKIEQPQPEPNPVPTAPPEPDPIQPPEIRPPEPVEVAVAEPVEPPPEVAELAPVEPPSTASLEADIVQSNYWSEVHMAVAQHVRYPGAARMREINGHASIQITLDSQGELLETLLQDSSHTIFSRALLAAANRAAPFPKPPRDLRNPFVTQIDVAFRLGD